MADINETQPIERVEIVEPADTVVAVETVPPASVPPNRPRKVYSGMWGPLEIAAVAVGLMVVLFAGVIYLFWVAPSSRELAQNRSEADRLEAEVISARTKYGEITDTETQVARIVTSIDDFEARFLPMPMNGQTALYQRLNGLISGYGLVNTSGPDYAPLETADANTGVQSEEERGRSKFRSLYPGVYVTTTLEGSYQNLRRFIREIETGREFIIVSAVELGPSDTEGRKDKSEPNVVQVNPTMGNPANPGFPADSAQPAQTSARQKGKMHGELVSLRIEMAAYFRRPDMTAAATRE